MSASRSAAVDDDAHLRRKAFDIGGTVADRYGQGAGIGDFVGVDAGQRRHFHRQPVAQRQLQGANLGIELGCGEGGEPTNLQIAACGNIKDAVAVPTGQLAEGRQLRWMECLRQRNARQQAVAGLHRGGKGRAGAAALRRGCQRPRRRAARKRSPM